MVKEKILVIVGPTASGKSDLAVTLARKFDGEVISADSRQVYEGLDVGTGKITKEDMQGVPHHLLDVANPMEQFSAAKYKELGERSLRDVLGRGKLPIVVGGTGFYIDILSCVINFPDVPPNPELRRKLGEKNIEELLQELAEKDPVRAKEVDQNNKLRIIRALEIVEALGKVPRLKPEESPHEFVYIGLLPSAEELDERIHQRLLMRLPAMIQEAEKLHSEGLTFDRMHDLGLEYRYLALYMQKKLSKEEMVEKLNTEIRRYAKRQMTWFKRNKNIKWFKPGEDKEIEEYLRNQL